MNSGATQLAGRVGEISKLAPLSARTGPLGPTRRADLFRPSRAVCGLAPACARVCGSGSPGHLAGGLPAALPARLDPHHPAAEGALDLAVELDLRAVRLTAVSTVPVPDGGFHGHSLSSPRTGDGRVPSWRAEVVGRIGSPDFITRPGGPVGTGVLSECGTLDRRNSARHGFRSWTSTPASGSRRRGDDLERLIGARCRLGRGRSPLDAQDEARGRPQHRNRRRVGRRRRRLRRVALGFVRRVGLARAAAADRAGEHGDGDRKNSASPGRTGRNADRFCRWLLRTDDRG